LYNDLWGTGPALSLDGLLSGTPIDTGLLAFTARMEDVAGAFGNQPLILRMRIFFICGDIDYSGG